MVLFNNSNIYKHSYNDPRKPKGFVFTNLLVVTEYYQQNAGKHFLKYIVFQNEIDAYNIGFFPRRFYICKKRTAKLNH